MSAPSGSVNELFEQAARTFKNVLRAGVTMQQESTKWFGDMLRSLGSPHEWQARNQAAITQILTTYQKTVDASLQMMMHANTRVVESWAATVKAMCSGATGNGASKPAAADVQG